MAWQHLFTYPLSAELYEWKTAGNIAALGGSHKSTSSFFLVKLSAFELDNPNFVTSTGVEWQRTWFNNYCAISEFWSNDANNVFSISQGKTIFFYPVLASEHSVNIDIEISLPYTPKPGDQTIGRNIAVRRLVKANKNQFYGRVQMYGIYNEHGRFGEVSGSLGKGIPSDDKMQLEIFHWIEQDFSSVTLSTLEEEVYSALPTTPRSLSSLLVSFPSYLESELINALESLERKGKVLRSGGRKGEYWQATVPF